MAYAIGFDVYGTLIDPLQIAAALRPFAGDRSEDLAQLWRAKQLEYSFLRGLMRNYQSFDVCTDHALQYAAHRFGVSLSTGDKNLLLEKYRKLPAYEDALSGIQQLKQLGYTLVAFSNGVELTVEELLEQARIMPMLSGVVSVDDLRTFKPDPRVYEYLARRVQTAKTDTWLVSANPFDVLGAKSAGLRAAWVKRRRDALFDPWGTDPDIVVDNLNQLADALSRSAS